MLQYNYKFTKDDVMIFNGIDLAEIERIEKSLKNERFKQRVYGKEELNELKNKKTESYAGAFCAKEAFAKALGTGIRNFKLNEVQVLHDEFGKPYFSLSGNAEKIANDKKLNFALSISHTEKYAVAMVTAYKED